MIDLHLAYPAYDLVLEILASIPCEPDRISQQLLREEFQDHLDNGMINPIWTAAKQRGHTIHLHDDPDGKRVSLGVLTARRIRREWKTYRRIVYGEN